jgi:sugar phosphate isomerase/epimerase
MPDLPPRPDYRDIISRCFINAPFEQLTQGELLKLFLDNSFQPEIGLEGSCLWDLSPDQFSPIARAFQDKGLACTLHAPFFDLAPGGFDRRVVEITREKLSRAFDLLPVFRPKSIVCHLGFEENKHRNKLRQWLDTALATWQPLLQKAREHDTLVMFENTYEIRPDVHLTLFEHLQSPNLGFCLDTGHLTAFARTGWQPWLDKLFPWLGQLHLHDNDGAGDHHLALGLGTFDFDRLFSFLDQKNIQPVLTLEPHSEKDLWKSLSYIQKTSLF